MDLPQQTLRITDGEPEPIPETQEAYHAQADAAIRDLFPRIPNTDRQMIIEHAFSKVCASLPSETIIVQMVNNNLSLRVQPTNRRNL